MCKKLFISLLVIICVLSFGLTLSACSKSHDHTFATEWSSDETNHWHACTQNGCTEKSDVAEHVWNNGVVTTEPTEGANGVKTFTCTICGRTKTEAVSDTNTLTVTYNVNGGNEIKPETLEKGTSLTLPAPTYSGKVFMGWYYDPEFGNKATTVITPETNVTLFARWGVYLHFNSMGGSTVESVLCDLNAAVGETEKSSKQGFISTGWFYDEECTKKVWNSDILTEETTVYAGFSNTADGYLKNIKSVRNVSETPEFYVDSTVLLNNSNINDYITLIDVSENKTTLTCRPNGAGKYIISPVSSLAEGAYYSVKNLTLSTNFTQVDEEELDGVEELTFNVYKAPVSNIAKKTTKFLNKSFVFSADENAYTYIEDGKTEATQVSILTVISSCGLTFSEGDLVSVGEGTEAGDNDYVCKVIACEKKNLNYTVGTGVITGEFYVLDVIIPSAEELYSSLEYYGEVPVDLSTATAFSPTQLESNIENNQGFSVLKATVKSALMQAPTVVNYMENLSSVEERTAFAAAVSNFNFKVVQRQVTVSDNILDCIYGVEGTIKYNNIKISIAITVRNTTELYCEVNIVKSGNQSANIIENYYIDGNLRFANSFSLEVTASIAFTDNAGGADVGATDISNEIKILIENAKDNINSISEAFTNDPIFDENSTELDYVDVFELPLSSVQIVIPSTPVTIGIDLSIVGQVGAKAGLSIYFDHRYEELIHFTNGDGSKDSKGRYNVSSSFATSMKNLNNIFDFELTLKGAIGFRCGLESKISISVAGLNKLASFYIAASFGPYIELSGLVNFTYQNVNGIKSTTVYGGIYLEAGIFCNLKGGLKIIAEFEADIFDQKYPIFTIGDRLIPIGFTDVDGNKEDPYLIYSNYNGTGTLPMKTEQMQYIDIVTGKKETKAAALWSMKNYWKYPEFEYVYEPAYLDYTMEIVDAPEYQNLTFEEIKSIVGIKFNTTFEVDQNFMLSELRFKVKITYKTKYSSSFTFPLSCYRYVRYINTSGKDASEFVVDNRFVNGYASKDLYGLWREWIGDSINEQELRLGELVANPYDEYSLLPKLSGYYLDSNDLWTRYKVRITNTNSVEIWKDENWDGVFKKIQYSDLSEHEEFYTFSYLYVLNWKPETFTAKAWIPTFDKNGDENGYTCVGDLTLTYNGYSFSVSGADKTYYPDIPGKRYIGHTLDGGSKFTMTYGLFNVTDEMRENDFALLRSGANFVAEYEDLWSYTETFYMTKETRISESVVYSSYAYPNYTEDDSIVRTIPLGMRIGDLFTVENVEYQGGNETNITKVEYRVIGYQLSNVELCQTLGYNFYSYESMPEIDCARNLSFIVLCEETTPVEVASYAVNITLTDVDGTTKTIATYRYPTNIEFDYACIKNSVDDLTVMRAATKQSVSLNMFESYAITWPEEVAIIQNSGNYYIDLDYTYTEKDVSIRFETDNASHRFVSATPVTDGNIRSVTLNGKYRLGSGNAEYYTIPELFDYIDETTKEYYTFVGWKNSHDELYYADTRVMFVSDKTYTPYYEKTPIVMTLTFINTNEYGYEYVYKTISGDYFGLTLESVVAAASISNPDRSDFYGKVIYSFKDWGVKDSYVIGTEKNSNGILKRDVTFYATYDTQKTKYTVTLDAVGGQFSDDNKTAEITDYYDAILDLSSYKPQNYTTNEGTYVFAYWMNEKGWRVGVDGSAIGIGDKTYKAYYTLNPKKVTVTIKGSVTTEASDGSGNVYFNGDKTKTELVVSDYYGTIYNLYSTTFAVDSESKIYIPKYVKFTVDGKEYTVDFVNVNALLYLPLIGDCEVHIFFENPVLKEERVAFISEGKCYELDGTEISDVTCKGTMGNCMSLWVFTANHGESVLAPNVYYYSASNYVFEGWALAGGDIDKLILPGDAIVADREKTYVAVYRHDTNINIALTFNAFTKDDARRTDVDDTIIDSIQGFDDGSVTLYNYGKEGDNVSFDKTPIMAGCKFVGWTTDGSTVLTSEEIKNTKYTTAITYYAVYITDAEKTYTVTLEAGNGLFNGNTTSVIQNNVPYGKLTSKLSIPVSNVDGLVFSHYENADGYPVTMIEEGVTLYAKYAIPVSTLEDLIAISQNPNADYVLTDNIQVTSPLTEWTPIGGFNGFNGTLNGNGYKISLNFNVSDVASIGLFSRIRGTIYNLVYWNDGRLNLFDGSTTKESIGGFASEITSSGRIIDCVVYDFTSTKIYASGDFSYGGAIGINRGLIDGLIVAAGGLVEIDTDGIINIGSAIGSNFGTIKNLSNTHMNGQMNAVIGKAQKKIYFGSVAGYNGGEILNSFTEPNISIIYSCGDNIYNAGFVQVGGIAGLNTGKLINCVSTEFMINYTVNNITLDKQNMSFTPMENATDGKHYYVYADYNNQTGNYDTRYVVYLDENVTLHNVSEYGEYTMDEYKASYPQVAGKFAMFDSIAVFIETAVDADAGSKTSVGIATTVGAGEIDELPLACGFNKLRWQYLSILEANIYK